MSVFVCICVYCIWVHLTVLSVLAIVSCVCVYELSVKHKDPSMRISNFMERTNFHPSIWHKTAAALS